MTVPTGKRGSWFADWRGESYPCVHERWFKVENGRAYYRDPEVSDAPKWGPFVEAIQTKKRVILTNDMLDERGSPITRSGYVAFWEVDNVAALDGELRFDFVKRLENFR